MRRFERVRDGKTQFWEARADGRFVCMTWGEVGGARKQLDRNLGTPEAAAAKLVEMIAQRVAEGYVEVALAKPFDALEVERVMVLDAPPPPEEAELPSKPALSFASSPELEQQCRQAPGDVGVWEIYGDWLLSQGDLRGDLAALWRGHKDRDAYKLVARHHDALFGTHAGVLQQILRDEVWRHGFLIGACLHDDPSSFQLDQVTAALLASPIGQFLERLQFGLSGNGNNNWGPTLRAVARSEQAPFFRELRFDAETQTEVSWISLGDLDGWQAFPRLERLSFRAGEGGTLGTLDLPALRDFEYVSCGISKAEIESIASARWPKLERLALWLGAEERGAIQTLKPLHRILNGEGMPALRHLGLCNTELVDDVILALAESPLLPRLHTLDLSRSTLVNSRALIDVAPAFAHLTKLDLDRNLLSDEHCDSIREVLRNASLNDQRYDELEDDDAANRYVALWE